MKFGFNWPSGFRGEIFEIVDDDNGMAILKAHIVSQGSGELKRRYRDCTMKK